MKRIPSCVFALWLGLLLSSTGMADLPKGRWSMSGEIVDLGVSGRGPIFTNTFSLGGYYDNGRFLLDLTPIRSMDDGAESVGWDGKLLCLIQRWSDSPHVDALRTNSLRTNVLAHVEPSVFSRYATFALQSVLIAFADSNLLSSLEKGQIPVILGPMRVYPEENNTYKVRHLSSGYTEIEAFSPGLELGESGLVPVKGLEQGFTRWTHRSNFTADGATDTLQEFFVEYNRFSPVRGKLVQNRAVTGKIVLRSENHEASVFRPAISEKTLTVLDYSSRYELLPWTKGIVDWCCKYEFNSQNWNFDTNYINAQVAQLKANMISMNGYPKERLAKANTLAAYNAPPLLESHRVIILCVLIGFSVLSFGAFWFGSRRLKQSGSETNDNKES
jgi:hypothetical protein